MNIVYCSNDKYSQHVAVSITSLIHNNQLSDFHFYIINSDFSDESKSLIEKCLNKATKKSNITFVKINTDRFLSLKLNISYISSETYFRYIISELLQDIDKCLYLDADTIVNKPITNLYNTDISNYYIAGVIDSYISDIRHKEKINLTDEDIYINAGVLLFNLNKIRNDHITEKLFNETLRLSNIIQFQDQDILNIVLKGKIKELPVEFNYTTSDICKNSLSKLNQASILHYTGSKKPWTHFNSSGNVSELFYYKYLQLSPYSKKYKTLILSSLYNSLKFICSRTKSGKIRRANFFKFNFFYIKN